jgi:hypothetical protein
MMMTFICFMYRFTAKRILILSPFFLIPIVFNSGDTFGVCRCDEICAHTHAVLDIMNLLA